MNHWLTHTVQHLQLGEALVAGGVDGLLRGWRAPGNLVGKLCGRCRSAGRRRYRDMPVTANLAEILRARTFR